MFRDAGVERVHRQRVMTLEQLEVLLGHDQMQISCFSAHRAIAVVDFDRSGRKDFEANSAAMAAA
jgi:hypothetical protein